MYFSSNHIGIKKDEDCSGFIKEDGYKALIICDGIGSLEESGKVSQLIVDFFIKNKDRTGFIPQLIKDKTFKNSLNKLKGGSTIITANINDDSNKIKIEYLGNGGIMHMHGDFANNPNSKYPFRYSELMMPHISPNGTLTKHVSHNSGTEELTASYIELSLDYPLGDILLFYTDGLTSLEEKIILKDNEDRFWRHESSVVQNILEELDVLIRGNQDTDRFQGNLIKFNKMILDSLHDKNSLEDDAALGIIITENVLSYYQSLSK